MESEPASKTIARRWAEDLYNGRDVSVADELYAPTYIYQGQPRSVETFKAGVERWLAAFLDLRITLVQVLTDGDRLAWHWRLTGTHRGSLFGLPATGNTIDINGIHLARVEEGVIVEEREWFEEAILRQQLGLQTTS